MKLQITTKSGEIIYYISKVIGGRTMYHPIHEAENLYNKNEFAGLVGSYVANGGSATWVSEDTHFTAMSISALDKLFGKIPT